MCYFNVGITCLCTYADNLPTDILNLAQYQKNIFCLHVNIFKAHFLLISARLVSSGIYSYSLDSNTHKTN